MLFLFSFMSLGFENDNPLRLWYTQPSSKMPTIQLSYSNDIWQQNTLPIGNGFIGANIYGEIKNEILTFNELTLREGGPSTKRPNYNGGNNIENGNNGATFREIQRLFSEKRNDEASDMCNKLVGDEDGYGTYLEFGEIRIDFDLDENQVTDYVRYLDLDESISYVQYNYQQSTITREYFVSHPDKVLLIKINSTKGPIPDFTVTFDTSVSSSSKRLQANEGKITFYGSLEDNQMLFAASLFAKSSTGTIDSTDGKLIIKNSNNVELYVSAATNFKLEHPKYRTGETGIDLRDRVNALITNATNKSIEKVRSDHIIDYQKIFNRVSLNLNHQPSRYPTNEQLSNYKKGSADIDQDRCLEVLLFQYGRYLSISSSREDGILPSNLQGLWNDLNTNVPWAADYHMNINLQMNYWPTYVTNMAETSLPLITYVESLRVPGRITAEIYTGVKSDSENPSNGFVAHTQSTPFGWTCPGWDFSWGWSPAAVPWILMNVFDYFLFTGDKETLRSRIYPMMKEECVYFEQIMVTDEESGRLVTSPTYSPEHGPRTPGNTYEQSILWQHYTNAIKAAECLGVDEQHVVKWKEIVSKLRPIEIGESGQIKEWYSETTLGSIGEHQHRHISHLLGLYPGDLITSDNAQFMDAAKVSLNDRGDISTGWAMGHRINAWARTGDGNRAYSLVHNLLTDGIYNNLWDYHPPFQIDGNFGATSGIAEMLLQSNGGYIHVLPSLPDVWSSGKFAGFVARGCIEVDCEWENGEAVEVVLHTKYESELIVQFKNIESKVIVDRNNRIVSFNVAENNRIKFNGLENEIYTITDPSRITINTASSDEDESSTVNIISSNNGNIDDIEKVESSSVAVVDEPSDQFVSYSTKINPTDVVHTAQDGGAQSSDDGKNDGSDGTGKNDNGNKKMIIIIVVVVVVVVIVIVVVVAILLKKRAGKKKSEAEETEQVSDNL